VLKLLSGQGGFRLQYYIRTHTRNKHKQKQTGRKSNVTPQNLSNSCGICRYQQAVSCHCWYPFVSLYDWL